MYFVQTANGTKEDGLVANLADCVNLINCIVDPLIYVVWFRDNRIFRNDDITIKDFIV